MRPPRVGILALFLGVSALLPASVPAQAADAPASSPLVVLDPGHGGEDDGLRLPGGPPEKHATLALAQALESDLARRGVTSVVLTRERDEFLPLEDRQSLMNRKRGTVFVSLHLADPEQGTAPELRVFSARFVEDKALTRLAAREVEAGVQVVPAALAQNPSLRASERLAKALVEAWNDGPSRTTPPAKAVSDSPIALLQGIRGPAVLAELAFRPAGRGAGWDSPARRRQAAGRLAAGIEAYLGRR